MSSVDVVIPSYNYAKYLPRCVASVLSQEGVDARVLIIDDASTDNTCEVGAELARQDTRVEYRRHVQNMRHIATYNEGLLDWASADYSLLLSADDLLAPNALQRAAHVMDTHSNVHMTYGMALLFSDEAALAESAPPDKTGYQIVPGAQFVRRCIAGNPVPTPAAVVRTMAQKSIGGYSPTLPHTADMEMWMRFAAYGSIGVVAQVLAYKRTHSANMSIQYSEQPLGDFRERVDACREFLATHGAGLGSAAPSLKEVREIIGNQAFWRASALAESGHVAACDEALKFAIELWPALQNTSAWQRLRLKRMLPGPVRSYLLPLIDKMRGHQAPGPASVASGSPARRHIGW